MHNSRTSLKFTKQSLHLFCGLLAFLSLQCGVMIGAGSQLIAKTIQGEVAGKLIFNGTQKAFLGIPYAAPPAGRLRWRAPQPPAAWSGIRDATKFGGRCEQWHIWNDYLFLDPGATGTDFI